MNLVVIFDFMKKNELLFHENLLDLSQTCAGELFFGVCYPWEVLPKVKDFILYLGARLPETEYKKIAKDVWASNESKIFDSAYIEGPTIIQKGSQIRHCAFIRGGVIVGENCVIGNSTEVKNAVLFNGVQVPHFNYVGDSVLGYKVHMGAGAITSNVKSDKSLISVNFNQQKIETNLKKFGAIIGDFTEIGCNAVVNPGTILGRNTTIYPTTMVRGFIPENTILKNTGEKITKFDRTTTSTKSD